MENLCPVCNSIVSINDKTCSNCGFSKLRRKFLTRKGLERWNEKVVIPYREKYEQSVYKQIMEKKDFVNFGKWYFEDETKKSPIEWKVITIKDNKAFLVSRYCIDSMPYNNLYTEITWEKCTLRKWLNGVFLQHAFSDFERKSIVQSYLNNDNNKVNFQNGGNDTYDKIFVLSVKEATESFFNNSCRKADITPYAQKKGLGGGNNFWWLRNPTINYLELKINKRIVMQYNCAEKVDGDGTISEMGCPVPGAGGIGGVRPALWVDLKIK